MAIELPDDTRDLVVKTAQKLEDVDHLLRDFIVESRNANKEASANFSRYNEILAKMKGAWWLAGILGAVAGVISNFLYHAFWKS